jgi:IQ domain-containing protein H
MADVPTPVSSVDIYDEQEFVLSLAKLIVGNLYVQTWVFKIDDEFNGRGTAYLNLDHVKSLSNLRKKHIPD